MINPGFREHIRCDCAHVMLIEMTWFVRCSFPGTAASAQAACHGTCPVQTTRLQSIIWSKTHLDIDEDDNRVPIVSLAPYMSEIPRPDCIEFK
ncbi:hypothetical protein ABBQ32_011923 [Trebouxia sp. C0010 RCD-2024]